MGSLLATGLLFIAATDMDVRVAPDQPIPHVYVGEPLVVEFAAPVDGQTDVHVSLVAADTGAVGNNVGTLALRLGRPRWLEIEGLAEERGYYRGTFSLEVAGGPVTRTAAFVRIDRPYRDGTLPIGATVRALDSRTLLALRGLALRSVRVDTDSPDFENALTAASEAGLTVAAASRLAHDSETRETAYVAPLAALAEALRLCELAPNGDAADLAAFGHLLRQSAVQAPLGLRVGSPDELDVLLPADVGRQFSHVVIDAGAAGPAGIASFRDAAERAGCEGLSFEVVRRGLSPAAADRGVRLAQQILGDLAGGAMHTTFNLALIYDDGEFSPAYAHVSALSHRLRNARFVGRLEVPSPATAAVFRTGDRWVAALWSTEGPHEVTLDVGAATDIQLADPCNNPLPIAASAEGALTVRVDAAPCFLSGVAGSVFAQAALSTARREASRFARVEGLSAVLPADAAAIAPAIAAAGSTPPERGDLLTLLQLFPLLEENWHTGALPRDSAVPAIAALARLVRALCTLEQEREQPFLEPLKSAFKTCGELQSAYVTGAGRAPGSRARATWLLAEVSRLMAEAEELAAEGRTIEADGVAALAVERARALEHLAVAPSRQPEAPAM